MEVEELEESQASDEVVLSGQEEKKDANQKEPREDRMDKLQM